MFGERLNATFSMPVLNSDDLNTRNEWQSYFCGALQTCINLLPADHLTAIDPASGMTTADKFMHIFLQVTLASPTLASPPLASPSHPVHPPQVFSSQNTTAAQEALLAVGSVCNVLPDGGFDRYMPAFNQMLVGLIAASNEPSLCVLALTTTSDVARTLESKMAAYTDPIVEIILNVLARPEVDGQISQVQHSPALDTKPSTRHHSTPNLATIRTAKSGPLASIFYL